MCCVVHTFQCFFLFIITDIYMQAVAYVASPRKFTPADVSGFNCIIIIHFIQKLIVITAHKHGNICIVRLNRVKTNVKLN